MHKLFFHAGVGKDFKGFIPVMDVKMRYKVGRSQHIIPRMRSLDISTNTRNNKCEVMYLSCAVN